MGGSDNPGRTCQRIQKTIPRNPPLPNSVIIISQGGWLVGWVRRHFFFGEREDKVKVKRTEPVLHTCGQKQRATFQVGFLFGMDALSFTFLLVIALLFARCSFRRLLALFVALPWRFLARPVCASSPPPPDEFTWSRTCAPRWGRLRRSRCPAWWWRCRGRCRPPPATAARTTSAAAAPAVAPAAAAAACC